MKGQLEHSFAEEDLTEVALVHKFAGTVPSHYLYAELLRSKRMPKKLELALARKPLRRFLLD